jgi:tRNA(Arg) A34 adenosine deaminase TadA
MIKSDYIFGLLEKVALSSDHERYFLAAAITLRNSIISFGVNRMKTDPMQAKYAKNKDCIYMHAEIHAIKNALKKVEVDDLRKADLYVLRVRNEDGKRAMAKPCDGCMRAIAEFGIRNVYFTNERGNAEVI